MSIPETVCGFRGSGPPFAPGPSETLIPLVFLRFQVVQEPVRGQVNRWRIPETVCGFTQEFSFYLCFISFFEGFRETMCPFWKPCAGGSAGMLIFTCFPNVFEGSWETVCAHANRVRIILHRSSEVYAYALMWSPRNGT